MTESLWALGTAVATAFLLAHTTKELAQRHPSDVRIVWFLFALAGVIALLLAHWAQSSGAIDSKGEFHGDAGKVLSFMLRASLDLKSSMLLGLAIVLVVLAPQLLSYVLAGLSGCASAPILVGGTLSFVAWGVVKSLAVASGVILVVPVYALFNGWSSWSTTQTLAMSLLSAMLAASAFSALYFYRGMTVIPNVVVRHCPQRLVRVILFARRWLTRRVASRNNWHRNA